MSIDVDQDIFASIIGTDIFQKIFETYLTYRHEYKGL